MVSANQPVLEIRNLKKHFPVRKGVLRRTVGQVYAVDGISFAIGVGETLGLVGESGCGKTTAGRAVLRLIEPTSGSIEVGGTDITHLSKSELRPYRKQMQIIFQDPFSSLNPRMTAGDIVGELFARPLHPYTVGLLASIPRLDLLRGEVRNATDRLQEIPGMVPPLFALPDGCAFAPRCSRADDLCRRERPVYEQKRADHWAACWHSDG